MTLFGIASSLLYHDYPRSFCFRAAEICNDVLFPLKKVREVNSQQFLNAFLKTPFRDLLSTLLFFFTLIPVKLIVNKAQHLVDANYLASGIIYS